MRTNNCTVTLLPMGKVISVPYEKPLREIILSEGLAVDMPCGGGGMCGKCIVEIDGKKKKSCRYIVRDNIEVRLPDVSEIKVAKNSRAYKSIKFNVNGIEKIHLTKEDFNGRPVSDQEYLSLILKRYKAKMIKNIDLLRKLPTILRKADYDVTVVLLNKTIIDIEPGDTSKEMYGISFDIGTTTLAAMLINLKTGQLMGIASSQNPQRAYGADVMARAAYIDQTDYGLECLSNLIITGINKLIDNLLSQCKVNRKYVYKTAFVGNTVMLHILAKVSPVYLTRAPYTPVFKSIGSVSAKELKLNINKNGICTFAPNIAGFVGGDTVGAILGTSFHKKDRISLLIDVGTNGEIVLGSKQRGYLACSAAAGPAFEGAHIAYGTRAISGAIEGVKIDDTVMLKTIDNCASVGICGSGLIEAASQMLSSGVLNEKGNIITHERLSEELKSRIITKDGIKCFVLSYKENNGIDEDIVITQKDIRELQLCKGAISAGITVLKRALGIQNDEIEEVLLAGGFGGHIDPESALKIGLLPPVELVKIKPVENAAGIGATMILCNEEHNSEGCRIAEEVGYVELSTHKDFQRIFVNSINFNLSDKG